MPTALKIYYFSREIKKATIRVSFFFNLNFYLILVFIKYKTIKMGLEHVNTAEIFIFVETKMHTKNIKSWLDFFFPSKEWQ